MWNVVSKFLKLSEIFQQRMQLSEAPESDYNFKFLKEVATSSI